jgi:hypothetical protein
MRRLCGIATLVVVAGVASGCATGFVNKPPSEVTETSGTINGMVWTTDGGEVAYWVEYGTTTAYDQETTHETAQVAEDTPHDVSIPLSGLTPSTTWHYRLCAEDAQAGTCSKDATLFTGDSVNGTAQSAGGLPFRFNAHSGPSGEDPGGTIELLNEDGSSAISASVVCLAVDGNRATIRVNVVSLFEQFFFVEDNYGSGSDRFGGISGQSLPPGCPLDPPADVTFLPVVTGGIEVIDGQPSPTSKDQ